MDEARSRVRGRGLRIVEENATTWGVIDRIDGKVVWAILQVVPHARR